MDPRTRKASRPYDGRLRYELPVGERCLTATYMQPQRPMRLAEFIQNAREAITAAAQPALRGDPTNQFPCVYLETHCTFLAFNTSRLEELALYACRRPNMLNGACAGRAARGAQMTANEWAAYVEATGPPPAFAVATVQLPPRAASSHCCTWLWCCRILGRATEAAKGLFFNRTLASLADQVVMAMDPSGEGYNGLHLRLERDARDWHAMVGGEEVRGAHGGLMGQLWGCGGANFMGLCLANPTILRLLRLTAEA